MVAVARHLAPAHELYVAWLVSNDPSRPSKGSRQHKRLQNEELQISTGKEVCFASYVSYVQQLPAIVIL